MLFDLLLFRAASPKGFRGIRFFAGLMFWLFIFIMGLGFMIELGSSPEQHDRHQHVQSRRIR